MIAKLWASCLLLLALSPLTAPFSTCDLSILLRHPIHHSGSHGRQIRRAPSTALGDSELSVPRSPAGGRDRIKRIASSSRLIATASASPTTARGAFRRGDLNGLKLSRLAVILRL